MKNNEMVSGGIVSFKLPEKFTDDHPGAAVAIFLVPIVLPFLCEGVKYIADKISYTKIECCRIKASAENGVVISDIVDDFEAIPTDDSAIA